MMMDTLASLTREYRHLGASRILCKRLAENDNSKQQIYLGPGFEALNLLPFGDLTADVSKKTPIMKAPISLKWLSDDGQTAPAPGAQLILYPNYPEVRLSGFLRGCPSAPARYLRPVSSVERRFNNGPDGRLLFLGIIPGGDIVACLAPADSALTRDFDCFAARNRLKQSGVFLEIPLNDEPDARHRLLEKLREIHAQGWHASCRLYASGQMRPYSARNGGGYTLEALFGIVPNGRAEPDFFGWELKAIGSDRVTLMTPEPDSGYYGKEGAEAFVRLYGHDAGNDTLYFTGTHRVGCVCESTGHRLTLRGFDSGTRRITDVNGGIFLIDADGEASAGWSFKRLLEHWGRKHASAAYVPYVARDAIAREYRYNSPVLLGEGTSFELFLAAMAAGMVIYDPGPKITEASGNRPKVKARSQFRIRRNSLESLYIAFSPVPIG